MKESASIKDKGSLASYKTFTASKSSAFALIGVPAICLSILVVELCERLAFYTFTGTQEFFLERVGYTLAEAGGLNAAMSTLCMCWTLAAGWVADVGLGRYQTIVVFGLLYAAGAFMATLAAWPAINSAHWYLIGVMVLVPMGTAGIKANISNFGADQYDTSIPEQAAAQEKFFAWFYFAINLGSAVAYGYLTTLGSNGGLGVPQKYGYFTVYLIASLCMLLAVCIFRSGRQHYRMQRLQPRSSISGIACYVGAAARGGSRQAASMIAGVIFTVFGIAFSVIVAVLPNVSMAKLLTYGAFVCAGLGIAGLVVPCLKLDWLGDRHLEDESLSPQQVGAFLRLLPVLFMANLAFSALYNSMQFWFQQQACQMDLRIPYSLSGAQFSGSFFMIADCLGIVVATPIAVDWLNPILDNRSGGRFGTGGKFALGMAFATCSVFLAAHIERLRRELPVLPIQSKCAPEGVFMSDIHAMWMVVPFFLMGLGEIYTQPVLMHFAYTKSPAPMRTLASVTTLVIGAVSNAIFTAQIAALSPIIPNDLNQGHLEYGHYLNIAIGAVFGTAYLAALRNFEAQLPAEEVTL